MNKYKDPPEGTNKYLVYRHKLNDELREDVRELKKDVKQLYKEVKKLRDNHYTEIMKRLEALERIATKIK